MTPAELVWAKATADMEWRLQWPREGRREIEIPQWTGLLNKIPPIPDGEFPWDA